MRRACQSSQHQGEVVDHTLCAQAARKNTSHPWCLFPPAGSQPINTSLMPKIVNPSFPVHHSSSQLLPPNYLPPLLVTNVLLYKLSLLSFRVLSNFPPPSPSLLSPLLFPIFPLPSSPPPPHQYSLSPSPPGFFPKQCCAAYPRSVTNLTAKTLAFSFTSLIHRITCKEIRVHDS